MRAASRGFAYARAPKLGFDLATGDAGLTIVHAALHRAFPGDGHLRRATRAIERAIAGTRGAGHPSLWAGFTGVVWALEHVQGRGSEEGDNAVDQVLPGLVAGWKGTFDLIDGLCGLAVYALERAPHPSASALLDAIVDRLGAMGERRAPGVTWRSNLAWLPPSHRHVEKGDCSLGVAHGVAGVVSVLGRTSVAAMVGARTRRRARSLLDRAVAWLLAQELPKGQGGGFPFSVEPRSPRAPREPTRLGWCHGDPGIAAALAVAAACTGEGEWLRAARRIALTAAARPYERSGVADAGLCHGAAGVGHLLHRVHRATGDPRLADAARAWLLRAVGMQSERARFGWTTPSASAGGRGRHESAPGLLFGSGGIVLALLGATGDVDLSWDRALGVSAGESTS